MIYLAYALIFFILYLIGYYGFRVVQNASYKRAGKPLFLHFSPFKIALSEDERHVLSNEVSFYEKLNEDERKFFEYRVARFISETSFEGRDEFSITARVRTLIAATAIMLTFGMKDFNIDLVQKIIVYPSQYFSQFNSDVNIGEFNPKFKALVFSWEHFERGFSDSQDNRNLGIHEFTHAIHLTSIQKHGRDPEASDFLYHFQKLELMLEDDDFLEQLRSSDYFREYAFTNKFEFVAVLVENFIATPSEFRNQFPSVYSTVKRMLNFDYSGY